MAGWITSHLAVATLLCAGLAAAKAAPAFEGRYVGGAWSKATKQYSQSLDIKRRGDGRFSVDAVVGTPDCSGVLEAIGAAEGDALKASEKQDNETCALTIRRTKTGVSVEEGDSCLSFHGASCEYRGDYRRR